MVRTESRRFCYIWQFEVARGSIDAFREHYGAAGAWVRLFRQHPGFVQTILLEDPSRPGRFLTIDRWQSEDAHDSFRGQFGDEYDELDRRCEGLALSETYVGSFLETDNDSSA
jgi:quinol monooxygenase YgiN